MPNDRPIKIYEAKTDRIDGRNTVYNNSQRLYYPSLSMEENNHTEEK